MIKQSDKVAHFCVSASIFFCVVWLLKEPLLGLIACGIFAFGKEIYDETHGGEFDWNDILADVLGMAFACIVWGLG